MIDKLISKHLNESPSIRLKNSKYEFKNLKDEQKIFYWAVLPNNERDYNQNDFWILELERVEDPQYGQNFKVKKLLAGEYDYDEHIEPSQIGASLNKEFEGDFFTDSVKKLKDLMKKYIEKEYGKIEAIKKAIDKL